MSKYVIGLDFATDYVNALVVNADTGETIASSRCVYPRWSKGLYCNPSANQWRQHPRDYIETLEKSVMDVLEQCSPDVRQNVVGLAFDTTGSTPVLVDESGMPLAMQPDFADNPDAMFILWKDHTAVAEAEEINILCKQWPIDYSKYVGGVYSAEWFWAKAIHAMREDDSVASKAYSVVEACEWLPAMVTGVKRAEKIVRSRCACGHKAMWNMEWNGFPSEEFLVKLDPKLSGFRSRMSAAAITADQPVGCLSQEWAERLGLSTKVIVAGGAYDCHMAAVGAGVVPNTMVSVIGASTCDVMVASKEQLGDRCIKGICGQVDGSVIPGMIGLEAGQSSFADVYAMYHRILMYPIQRVLPEILREKMTKDEIDTVVKDCSQRLIERITNDSSEMAISNSNMIATDWINGRRSPDANQLLQGTISGFTLSSNAPQVMRALVEATAFGAKAIVERFESEGICIDEVIGIGEIALREPFIMRVMCDVLNKPIKICNTDNACALGAAMFAATAAGIYENVQEAIGMMNSGFFKEYTPIAQNVEAYAKHYDEYIRLGRTLKD